MEPQRETLPALCFFAPSSLEKHGAGIEFTLHVAIGDSIEANLELLSTDQRTETVMETAASNGARKPKLER
jgi:hypothetical protein